MADKSLFSAVPSSVATDPHDAITLGEKALSYRRKSSSEATRRAYASDWADFESFARRVDESPLPALPHLIERYVSELADGSALATIRRRLVSISRRHQAAGLDTPTTAYVVRETMKGISRDKGSRPQGKAALTTDLLKLALRECGTDLKGLRDRAIMLLGFSGAFRRSELAALDVEDLRFEPRGMVVHLRRSKTDQEARGRDVAIPLLRSSMCPVAAVRTWLRESDIRTGPLFVAFGLNGRVTGDRISGRVVERLVTQLARRAGLDGKFAAHSLRAGFVTSAAERHVDTHRIAKVTGHKSQTVLAGYIRSATLFDDSPLAVVMRKR